jgi:tetratricopeptide (TPR) repeat protein
MLGNHDQALADLNKTLEIEPKSVFALRNRGAVYYLLHNYNQALADLDKALQIEPKDALALTLRGAVHRKLDNYNNALADLDKALEVDPYRMRALLECGELYSDQSKTLPVDVTEYIKTKLSNRFIRSINLEELVEIAYHAKGGFGIIRTACFTSEGNAKVALKSIHLKHEDAELLFQQEVG